MSRLSGSPSGTPISGTFRSAGAGTVFCSLRIAPAPRPRSLVSSTSSERVSVTANSIEGEERFFWPVSLISDLISLILSKPTYEFTRWTRFDPNVQPFPAGPGPSAPQVALGRPGFVTQRLYIDLNFGDPAVTPVIGGLRYFAGLRFGVRNYLFGF